MRVGLRLNVAAWSRRRDTTCPSPIRRRCSSPSAARPRATWSSTTCGSRSRSCGRWAAGPCCCSASPRAPTGPSFFQKRVPKNIPDWLQTTIVSTPNGTTSHALVAADLAHVLWAVNIGCLGFHVWPYLAADPDAHRRAAHRPRPDARHRTSPRSARRPHELKTLLDELGIAGYPKTTGNRGIHVYVRLEPRWDSYEVRSAAVAVARELERRRPDLITAAWWKEERGERVFIDFNQNAPHKTVFGAWSVRARPGAQVSTPLAWDETRRHPSRRVHDRVAARAARAASATRGRR